jgi:hypothetical protein
MIKCGQDGTLIIHMHLANSLRMRGAKPPLYPFTAWIGTALLSLALRWSNAQCIRRKKGSKMRRTDCRHFFFFSPLLLERLALHPLWSSNSELTSDKWWHSDSQYGYLDSRSGNGKASSKCRGQEKHTHKKAYILSQSGIRTPISVFEISKAVSTTNFPQDYSLFVTVKFSVFVTNYPVAFSMSLFTTMVS